MLRDGRRSEAVQDRGLRYLRASGPPIILTKTERPTRVTVIYAADSARERGTTR